MEFEITQPETIIGRVAPSDLLIPGSGVSSRHARLLYQDGKLRIEDLESTNGTFVNGQRISEAVTLRNGDQIGLGQNVRLVCSIEAQPGVSTEVTDSAAGGTRVEASPAMPSPPRPIGRPSADPPPPPRPAPPPPGPSGAAATVIGEIGGQTGPSELSVSVAGGPSQTYPLNRLQVTIGREQGNDIVIGSKIVSRNHARLEKREDGGYNLVVEPTASNPTFLDGATVTRPTRLHHGAKIRIGSNDPGLMVTMTYLAPSEALSRVETVRFGEKSVLQIGRDPTNDIVLDIPQVSRHHALIERVGKRYRVRDLRSSNGTFVNNRPVEGEMWLNAQDTVRIGSYNFVMGEDELSQIDESGSLEVEAVGLNKWVRKDLNILQNISLNFEPREFIVVVGQSGGGKSTLVDSIAGYRPATHGKVFVNGIDVYENFDAIRNNLGYVPQKDIIHKELTVFQALDYSAQLRMPPDTSKAERHQRVMETLEDLDIAHRKDTAISQLSGGQQKRVSIGVELLTRPGLFFLDEPSSGLDPGTETALMQLMRRLADQGRTIVLITHATKNVMLADKVVFLARGGYLVWFGAPDEALSYFNQYRSERDQRAGEMEFDEIYALLDDSQKGSPQEWAERYMRHPAYNRYVATPLADRSQMMQQGGRQTPETGRAATAGDSRARKQVSALRQFFILSARNLKILTRDRFSLALMLLAPPVIGSLDILLASLMGRDPFAWADGDAFAVIITLFILTIYGVMLGGISQMREIVKEGEIYKRERLVNLKIIPYIFSKVWVAGLLALYQAIWYIGIHYFAFDMPGGATEFVLMYISMALATMGGMMLGLFASALAPSSNAAPLIVIVFMLPQIVLGGALVPVPEFISAPFSTRWGFEAFMAITGVGSDIAADPCWDLPPETISLMDLEQRTQECSCMGLNIIDQSACHFPGMGQFYVEGTFEETELPPEPAPLRDPPPEPDVPPPPIEPENQADTVAVAEYLAALQEYQVLVEGIQEQYKADLEAYQAEADIYAAEFAAYQEAVVEQEFQRFAAAAAAEIPVSAAEGAVYQIRDSFGWAWVDKGNTGEYYGRVLSTWAAQGLIIGVLLTGTLIMQKRKDN